MVLKDLYFWGYVVLPCTTLVCFVSFFVVGSLL